MLLRSFLTGRSPACILILALFLLSCTTDRSPPSSATRHPETPVPGTIPAPKGKQIQADAPGREVVALHSAVNAYRKQHGLAAIPLSKSLTRVAELHAKDLDNNSPAGACNYHSWSKDGPWASCCYTADHARATCMWNKPKELTVYPGKGYENAYMRSTGADADNALRSWKASSGHNAVILNQGIWKNRPWKSMGVGIHGKYATVWFGEEPDPDGYWR